jgi:4-amino-4-deoxy-L-arabinose transferase-like glycosyltransferase
MQTPRGRDLALALLLMAGTAATLGLAQRGQGVMRDEGTYFQAAESYWGWFASLRDNSKRGKLKDSFTASGIGRYFRNNNEHPVLFKLLMGVSWRYLAHHDARRGQHHHPVRFEQPLKGLGLFSEITAFRAPGWLFCGLCAALLYLFGMRIEGRLAGLAAALLYVTIPRVFFHGQLACFDSAITTMWLLVVYAYFRSLESARWGILAGLAFGLALATKHNAWFIPALLLLHYLMVVWPDVSLRPLHLPRIPLVFVAMAILGPLVFLAHWPWLWFDTVNHIRGYFGFHMHHSYYNIEYLGRNWGLPPLPVSYPFGMTLFTAPTILLVLFVAGTWLYLRGPLLTALSRFLSVRPPAYDSPFRYPARRSWLRPGKGLDPQVGRLLGINALFPLVLIALPSTPIFGATKHWLPAYPFVALLAGVALSRLARAVGARRLPGAPPVGGRARATILAALLVLLPAAPGAINTALTHPYGLSQYNALAGGPAGGADLGLNRQFWGYAVRTLLPWMNETFDRRAQVYFHDTSYDAYGAYIRDGLLRPDIRYAGMERPAIENPSTNYAMVHYELHFNKYDYWIWDAFGTATPIKVLDLDGVPLVSVYKRPAQRPPPDGASD